MFGLLDYLKIGVGAALGALVVAGPLYIYGKYQGRQQAAVAALEASVKALRERDRIDDEISAADVARLCADLGLSGDEARECVRRLAQANAQP